MALQGDPERALGLLQSQKVVEKECQGADLQEEQSDLFRQQEIVEKDYLGDQEEKLHLGSGGELLLLKVGGDSAIH